MKPIIGNRYKCAVCEDFDYCEKCEESIDHPHPFLKIKNESQHPVAIMTILREDAPPKPSTNASSLFSKLAESLNISSLIPKLPVIKAEVTETTIASVENIYTEIKEIIKSVTIKNTGNTTFPKNSFIEATGDIIGAKVPVPELEAGKTFSTVLVIKSPCQAGNFASFWRVGYTDDKKQTQYVSETCELNFTILNKPVVVPKVEKKVETETAGREFAPEIVTKAKWLSEFLPQYTLEFLTEAVYLAGDLEVEDLMENLIS